MKIQLDKVLLVIICGYTILKVLKEFAQNWNTWDDPFTVVKKINILTLNSKTWKEDQTKGSHE